MSAASCVSESSFFKLLMRCASGRTADTVTYDSPEECRIEEKRHNLNIYCISCHVGTKFTVFLSNIGTSQIASSCSSILFTNFAIIPHLVDNPICTKISLNMAHACAIHNILTATRAHWERLRFSKFFLVFPARRKGTRNFLQIPKARLYWWSLFNVVLHRTNIR